MAHDDVRGRTMLFGGFPTTGPLLGDVWEWDGTSWAARFSQHYPPPRSNAAMVFDRARGRIVLFGGAGNGLLNDTWEWDGVDWVEVTPATSPSPRHSHTMSYDVARQRVVLFGGLLNGSFFSNQTWEWDGVTWLLRTPANAPAPRMSHGMAYDELRQRTVLFGGRINSNQERDTWEWDGVDWSLRSAMTSAMPNGRKDHKMAYDTVRQTVVLYGGDGGGADTVEWNGVSWQAQSPATNPPSSDTHAMAFDRTRQRMVLFLRNGSQSQTWTRGQFGTTAVAATYGMGCGAPALTFAPSTAARPIIGQVASATIDQAPANLAAVAIGWSNTNYGPFALPVTLAAIGMPGCELLQSSDVLGLATTVTGPATLRFDQQLPNDLSIVGQTVFLQAYALAPGANARQVVASNGIEWFVGDL
ncbi:MAG: kelch repeat-containing protein [Planctomycetota bacterium]